MNSVIKWLINNEASWLAGVIVSILEIGVAYWAKHGLEPEVAPMIHGLIPLLVAPLLRLKVYSQATVDKTAEASVEATAAAVGEALSR